MYFNTRDGYEESGRSPFGLAPAIAGGGIVITVGAVIEAILFVLSAIAAAYLLIKAYEKAKSLGIGVGWAGELLVNAMRKVVEAARRVVRELGRLIEQAGRQRLPPNCEPLLALLRERLARIEDVLRRYFAEPRSTIPRTPIELQLLRELEDSMWYIRPLMERLRDCLRA